MASTIPDRLYKDPHWALSHYPTSSVEWLIAKQLLKSVGASSAPDRTTTSSQLHAKAHPTTVAAPKASVHTHIQASADTLPSERGEAGSRIATEADTPKASSNTCAEKRPDEITELRLAFIRKHGHPTWLIQQTDVMKIKTPEDVYKLYSNARVIGNTAMKRGEKDFKPDVNGFWNDTVNLTFMPPMGDVGLPKSKAEEMVIVHSFTEAILNSTGVHDNMNAAHMTHWNLDVKSKFQRWQVDAISRIVLDVCVKMHKDGFNEPIFDRGLREKVNPDLTFDERVNCVIILLSKWKSLCETVMKGEKIPIYVAGPATHYKSTGTNKDNNGRRKDNLHKLNAEINSLKGANNDVATAAIDGGHEPSSSTRKTKITRRRHQSRRSGKLAFRAESEEQALEVPRSDSAVVVMPSSPPQMPTSPSMSSPATAASTKNSSNNCQRLLSSSKRDPKLPPIGNFKIMPTTKLSSSPTTKPVSEVQALNDE